MKFYYCVIVSYLRDKAFVHLAESPSLEEMKQLALLICRNALPEISWVKIEDQDAGLVFYWQAPPSEEDQKALLNGPPASNFIN